MSLDDIEITQADLDRAIKHEDKYRFVRKAFRLHSLYLSNEIGNKKELSQTQIRGVVQREYGVTDSKSSVPVVGTWGLATCVAVTAYEPDTKTAGVAHLDSSKVIDSLKDFLKDVAGSQHDLSQLKVGLIGGEELSKDLINETIEFLEGNGVSLKYAEILDKPHPTAFVLDSRDGKIYPNIVPENCGDNLDARYGALSNRFTLLKSFDGRISKE